MNSLAFSLEFVVAARLAGDFGFIVDIFGYFLVFHLSFDPNFAVSRFFGMCNCSSAGGKPTGMGGMGDVQCPALVGLSWHRLSS